MQFPYMNEMVFTKLGGTAWTISPRPFYTGMRAFLFIQHFRAMQKNYSQEVFYDYCNGTERYQKGY